jgi:hypothetical protein
MSTSLKSKRLRWRTQLRRRLRDNISWVLGASECLPVRSVPAGHDNFRHLRGAVCNDCPAHFRNATVVNALRSPARHRHGGQRYGP